MVGRAENPGFYRVVDRIVVANPTFSRVHEKPGRFVPTGMNSTVFPAAQNAESGPVTCRSR